MAPKHLEFSRAFRYIEWINVKHLQDDLNHSMEILQNEKLKKRGHFIIRFLYFKNNNTMCFFLPSSLTALPSPCSAFTYTITFLMALQFEGPVCLSGKWKEHRAGGCCLTFFSFCHTTIVTDSLTDVKAFFTPSIWWESSQSTLIMWNRSLRLILTGVGSPLPMYSPRYCQPLTNRGRLYGPWTDGLNLSMETMGWISALPLLPGFVMAQMLLLIVSTLFVPPQITYDQRHQFCLPVDEDHEYPLQVKEYVAGTLLS